MNDDQKTLVCNYRESEMSYGKIASTLGLSRATVSSYCHRNSLGGTRNTMKEAEEVYVCPNCGKIIQQEPKHKKRKFCSDECCQTWWNNHPEAVHRRTSAIYFYTCACCGKPFRAYGNNHRKYCSQACYLRDRFGENA